LNLYNAVGVAADPKAAGRGVLVVMNDWIQGAHSLTKTSTTAVQTFMSPLRGLVGTANYGKNDYFTSPEWKHTTQSEFDITGVTTLPRVDIIYASADMSPDLIDCAAASAKGIVIAGVGNGQHQQVVGHRRVQRGKEGRRRRAKLPSGHRLGWTERRAQ
jgi:L-asparaginase